VPTHEGYRHKSVQSHEGYRDTDTRESRHTRDADTRECRHTRDTEIQTHEGCRHSSKYIAKAYCITFKTDRHTNINHFMYAMKCLFRQFHWLITFINGIENCLINKYEACKALEMHDSLDVNH